MNSPRMNIHFHEKEVYAGYESNFVLSINRDERTRFNKLSIKMFATVATMVPQVDV